MVLQKFQMRFVVSVDAEVHCDQLYQTQCLSLIKKVKNMLRAIFSRISLVTFKSAFPIYYGSFCHLLTLETSAFESLYGGLFTVSTDKTKLSCNTPHRRSTTVSLETLPATRQAEEREPGNEVALWPGPQRTHHGACTSPDCSWSVCHKSCCLSWSGVVSLRKQGVWGAGVAQW